MSLPENVLKKWREDVNKVCSIQGSAWTELAEAKEQEKSHQSTSPQVPPPPPPPEAEPRVVELLRTLPPEFRIERVQRVGIIRPRLRVTVSTRV